jgi:thiosulfate/3-mercaptopyruvate sulfurtransferase
MITLPGPLVSAAWLHEHHADVLLADVRWNIATGPQPDAYRSAHLPGAIFVDLDADLSSPAGPGGRHPLPEAGDFAATIARLGLDRRPVVAYDTASGAIAARLWWMLDALGLPVAVLDGGLDAWTHDLEDGWVEPSASPPVEQVWPDDRFVSADEVLPAIAAGATVLDARGAERFAGEPNAVDTRPGHIPGSDSRPWQDNLDETGRLRSADELAAELGPEHQSDLITSCGSGVTGCHTLLAARVGGHPGGRLYVGSWSEWSQDPNRPVATDT